jgi:hypothetical protein
VHVIANTVTYDAGILGLRCGDGPKAMPEHRRGPASCLSAGRPRPEGCPLLAADPSAEVGTYLRVCPLPRAECPTIHNRAIIRHRICEHVH